MPRNTAGTYSLPNSPFVFGTIIDQDVVNDNFNDLSQAVTGSLARNGAGGMLAPFRGVDGTAAIPAYSFTSENGLGFYRAGTDDMRASSVGTDIMKWSATEVRTYRAAFFENGITVTSGGIAITLGGISVAAGGLTVANGGSSLVGAMGANGAVSAAHTFEATGLSTTTGHTQPLTSVAKTQLGGNTARLNVRTQNTGAVTGWEQVRLGLSYDVDTSVGAGGAIYFGSAPAPSEALTNVITPTTNCKAWAVVTSDGLNNGAASLSLLDGANIASIGLTGGNVLTVTLAAAMANTTYCVVASFGGGSGGALCVPTPTSTTVFEVQIRDQAFVLQSLPQYAGTMYITVFGRQ